MLKLNLDLKMKLQTILLAVTTAITTCAIGLTARADTVNARCDIYPLGEDQASAVLPCTFSQRQGAVGIQLSDGRRYDLSPVGDQPGNYIDQDGQAVYRQSGLGDRGQIYRFATESIYVYWDTAGLPSSDLDESQSSSSVSSSAQSSTPVTYVTVLDDNHIMMQITEGEFRFHNDLERTSGNTFVGQDEQVRVTYDRSTGRIVVINAQTGTEFYNYIFSEANEGEF
ncbi:MAG: hypothetical protein Kow00121_30900 [Elainellaceae cyanobacterium]